MTNTSLCSLAFKYQEASYVVTGLNLLQANFACKFKENTAIGQDCRQYLDASGTRSYSLEISCILRETSAHKALLQLANGNKTQLLTIKLGNKWGFTGPFLICKSQLKTNRSGHMTLQINLESNGEIKNDL